MTSTIKDDIIDDFYKQIEEHYTQKDILEDQIDYLYNLIFQRTEFLKFSARTTNDKKATA